MSSTEARATKTPNKENNEKKEKAVTDGSVKKRKREEEQSNGVVAEPVAKQSKKQKTESVAEATSATSNRNGGGERKVTAEPSANGAAPQVSAKKPKKSKKRDEVISTNGAVPPAPATEATPSTKGRQTKKRRPTEASVGAVNGHDISTLATASSSGPSKGKIKPSARSESQLDKASAPFSDDSLQKHSPFAQETHSLYLALSPCANSFPLEGLVAEHVSPLLLTYYPPLKGVVLKYSNARMSERPHDGKIDEDVVMSKAIDEYAVTFVWLTVDFMLLRPSRGCYLEGHVNLQNESLLGLMCYNYFSAAIEYQRLPKDWQWLEDDAQEEDFGKHRSGGHWTNRYGEKVEGKMIFRVRDFDATGSGDQGAGSISIAGTLLSGGEDKRMDDEEMQRDLVSERRR